MQVQQSVQSVCKHYCCHSCDELVEKKNVKSLARTFDLS